MGERTGVKASTSPAWKRVLGSVAPVVAAALGGPLAGVAVQRIGAALGLKDATEDQLEAAIAAAPPETLAKLKELELAFQKEMATLGIELERLDAGDRASSRARQVSMKDWTPNILAFLVLGIFLVVQWTVIHNSLPESTKDSVIRTLGTLDMMVGAVVQYFFGSSRSSRAKDEVLGRVAEKA